MKSTEQRRRLLEMAERSEKAIASGSVMSLSEARKRSKRVLREIAATRTTILPQ